jgi:hypothetical protein
MVIAWLNMLMILLHMIAILMKKDKDKKNVDQEVDERSMWASIRHQLIR